jgi:TPR repeat protein
MQPHLGLFLALVACAHAPGDQRSKSSMQRLVFLCSGGDPAGIGRGRACVAAGLAWIHGDGVPRDDTRAAAAFRTACELDEVAGCRNLAILAAQGRGVGPPAVAAEALRAACRLGDRAACATEADCDDGDAASCAALGGRVPRVPELKWHQRACARGAASSCHRAAALREAGGDAAAALELHERGCVLGEAAACTDAGWLRERGGDAATAAERYAGGCTGGDAAGCYDLALLARDGRGVARDAARALALAVNACDRDVAAGCLLAGELALDGDPPGAEGRMRRACELGDVRGCALADAARAGPLVAELERARIRCDEGELAACHNLAVLVEPRDAARAATLYDRACRGGSSLACSNLGRLYERGRGVARDPRRALALFALACAAGERVGCFNEGVLEAAARRYGRAREAFGRACALGDAEACARRRDMPRATDPR